MYKTFRIGKSRYRIAESVPLGKLVALSCVIHIDKNLVVHRRVLQKEHLFSRDFSHHFPRKKHILFQYFSLQHFFCRDFLFFQQEESLPFFRQLSCSFPERKGFYFFFYHPFFSMKNLPEEVPYARKNVYCYALSAFFFSLFFTVFSRCREKSSHNLSQVRSPFPYKGRLIGDAVCFETVWYGVKYATVPALEPVI